VPDPEVPSEPEKSGEPELSADDPTVSREAPPQMPTSTAYLLAFVSVVIAGVFGGIIGYGLADVGCTGDCEGSKLLGTVIGATVAAGGVGIVAVLVLRAMAEWRVKTRRG
jgi:hypothetical protein